MMEQPIATHAIPRNCPQCGIDLAERGIYDVRNVVSAWTRWRPEPTGRWAGRWDVVDEDIEYTDGSTLECAACGEPFSPAHADQLLREMERAWTT